MSTNTMGWRGACGDKSLEQWYNSRHVLYLYWASTVGRNSVLHSNSALVTREVPGFMSPCHTVVDAADCHPSKHMSLVVWVQRGLPGENSDNGY